MDILDYTPIFTRKKIREEFVQEFDIEQLEKFSLAFIDSIEAKKNKIAEEELKLQENKKFITETLKEFNVRGIDINHISKVIEKKRKTKKQKPRAAKYTWKENGEIKRGSKAYEDVADLVSELLELNPNKNAVVQ